MTSVKFVSPGMSVPLKRHWYRSGALPLAVTEKFAVLPALTIRFCGCWLMLGGELMVSVATMLVAEPNPFVTTTE